MNKTKRGTVACLFLATCGLIGYHPVGLRAQATGPVLLNSSLSIVVNPSGLAPLTAVANFTTSRTCDVQVRVLGDIEVTQYIEDSTTTHSIPILGLYPGRVNTVVLSLFTQHGTPESHTVSISTDPLPDLFPDIVINTATPGLMEPGMNLSAFSVGGPGFTTGYPFIFDAHGQIRWYLKLSQYQGATNPFERLKDGNFVFGNGPSVYEYDMLGNKVLQITIPGYNFHHDIKELSNGHLIACVDEPNTYIVNSHGLIKSQGDHMIELDRATGADVKEWDMRQILDVSRNEQINATGDWFHMNGIWYSAPDDCFIISGRHQGVVKVTHYNQLKWILAAHTGWGPAGFDGTGPDPTPFLLTAVNSAGIPYGQAIQDGLAAADDFDWTWGQHAPMILPNGDFFMFDNGDGRDFSYNGPFFSRAVEFSVNEAAMTAKQIWEYGKERGEDLFSRIISDVDFLPYTGNRLMAPGIGGTAPASYAKVVEVIYPDKNVVFEATLNFKNLQWTGSGVGDNVFRSHRISLYPTSPVSAGLTNLPDREAPQTPKPAGSRLRLN